MQHIPAVLVPEDAAHRCNTIAYQYTGGVQSHAALLVVNASTGRVMQASANIDTVMRLPAASAAGASIDDLPCSFADGTLADLVTAAEEQSPHMGPNALMQGVEYTTRHHRLGDRVFIEFEPRTLAFDVDGDEVAHLLPDLLDALTHAATESEAASIAARVVRNRLGYDRCMVYRFDADWNGEVIGEDRSTNEDESFLGLRFPARDIPASVREMYKVVGVRVSLNPADEGSPLEPLEDPETGKHTDLTFVRSRVTLGPCRTYYSNMGVRSTMVLPVVRDDRVWGHIALHHREERRPSPVHDGMLTAVAKAFSATLSRIEHQQRLRAEQVSAEIQSDLVAEQDDFATFASRIKAHMPELRELLECDALVLSVGTETYQNGAAVAEPMADQIVGALSTGSGDSTVQTSRLVIDHPELEGVSGGFAGALAVRIGDTWDDYLLALRVEKAEDTHWAGNPADGVKPDETGRPRLTPRGSFEDYVAATAKSAREWSDHDQRIAESCSLLLGLKFLRHQAAASARTQAAFLANMSHEIRTPMTAILGFADLLVGGSLSGDAAMAGDAAKTIQTNASHLLTIINDLLDISKVEAGKLDVEAIATDVIVVADQAAELLRSKASGKGVTLSVAYDTPVPSEIQSDPTRLRQILLNLLGNAVKFTEHGSVTLRMAYDADAGLLRLSVVDTGIGMSAEELERVRKFEPFGQADVSMTRRFGGTGLGLSISNSLARLLGGRIEVDSTPGAGSTFAVTLSVQPGAAGSLIEPSDVRGHVAAVMAEPASSGDDLPESPLAGMRILLVEDGRDNQRLISFHLKKAGATVEIAQNGRLAVDRVGTDPDAVDFDLIFMDMQMPEMDGYEATRWLREHAHRIPVIALTAHAMSSDETKCLEAGCNAFETKPINAQRLITLALGWGRVSS